MAHQGFEMFDSWTHKSVSKNGTKASLIERNPSPAPGANVEYRAPDQAYSTRAHRGSNQAAPAMPAVSGSPRVSPNPRAAGGVAGGVVGMGARDRAASVQEVQRALRDAARQRESPSERLAGPPDRRSNASPTRQLVQQLTRSLTGPAKRMHAHVTSARTLNGRAGASPSPSPSRDRLVPSSPKSGPMWGVLPQRLVAGLESGVAARASPGRASPAGRYDGRQESARGGRRSSEKHPHVLVHAREEARAQLQHPPDSSRRQPSARGGGGGGEVVSLSFRERLAHNQLARSHPPPSGDGAGTDGGGARYRRGTPAASPTPGQRQQPPPSARRRTPTSRRATSPSPARSARGGPAPSEYPAPVGSRGVGATQARDDARRRSSTMSGVSLPGGDRSSPRGRPDSHRAVEPRDPRVTHRASRDEARGCDQAATARSVGGVHTARGQVVTARPGAPAVFTAREDSSTYRDDAGDDSAVGSVGAHSPTEGVYIVSRRVAPPTAENGYLRGYTLGRLLGEGGFCKVRLGIHTFSGLMVAVKMIDKSKLVEANDRRRVGRELRVLKRLTCSGVIKLYEVVDGPDNIYVVMEYADGGSLLDYVRMRKRCPEHEARHFFTQMVQSLQYCHQSSVVHRDVKLENVLMDKQRNMKLIDFGLSAFMSPGKKMRVHCGSPSYASPEIISRKLYDGPPVDVWSLGVVLFAMVTGYLPFHAGQNKQELCQKIVRGQFATPDFISQEVADLLHRMLVVDPDKRITFPLIMQHPWVRNTESPCRSMWFLADGNSGQLELEPDIIKQMNKMDIKSDLLHEAISSQNQHNYVSTCYFLLINKRESFVDPKDMDRHTCPCLAKLPPSREWLSNALKTAHMDSDNPYSLIDQEGGDATAARAARTSTSSSTPSNATSSSAPRMFQKSSTPRSQTHPSPRPVSAPYVKSREVTPREGVGTSMRRQEPQNASEREPGLNTPRGVNNTRTTKASPRPGTATTPRSFLQSVTVQ